MLTTPLTGVSVVLGCCLALLAVVTLVSNPTNANSRTTVSATVLAGIGGKKGGGIGPAWTYDNKILKPLGTVDMGSYTEAVYTPAQQEQLGVNEEKDADPKPSTVTLKNRASTQLGFVRWVTGLLGGKTTKTGCQRCFSENKNCCGVKSDYQCWSTSSSECRHLRL